MSLFLAPANQTRQFPAPGLVVVVRPMLGRQFLLTLDPELKRLSYDFFAKQARKKPLGEGRLPLVSGEGRIVETQTV